MAKKRSLISDADFSKLTRTKQREIAIARATRTNPETPLHANITPLVKSKAKIKWEARKRAENEATGPEADLFKRPIYVLGDGDTPHYQRPGSDHSHIKSFGLST